MLYYPQVLQQFRDGYFGKTDDLSKRLSYQILRNALWDLVRSHDWPYYNETYRITTTAPYSTGTISISSATPTLVTGSGTTFTSDMVGCYLVVNGNHPAMQILKFKSATELYLRSDHAWSGDSVSGASYSINTQMYELPGDFRSMYRPIQNENNTYLNSIDPDVLQQFMATDITQGEPLSYTIRQGDRGDFSAWNGTRYVSSPRNNNRYLMLWPMVDDVYTYDITYQRWPTWKSTNYTTGSISTTTTAVTGAGTAFTSDMVGDYLFIGDTNTVPDPVFGSETAYRIDAVGSGTSLTLSSAPSTTSAGTLYRIGSSFDLEQRLEGLYNMRVQLLLSLHRGDPRIHTVLQQQYKILLSDTKQDSDETMGDTRHSNVFSMRRMWLEGGEVFT
jgi:hypothetical protein